MEPARPQPEHHGELIERSEMKRSTSRILTTHVGSLIRPPALLEFLRAKQTKQPIKANLALRSMSVSA